MIPLGYITQWQQYTPWPNNVQVEQDLILSRIIVEIFSDPLLANKLAFRGGTALHKLFFDPPARYSEDIDLVRTDTGPIKEIIDALRNRLDPWLGPPQTKQNQGSFKLLYSFNPETLSQAKQRIKIEMNTRECFSVFPYLKKEFSVQSPWFTKSASVQTYQFEELLGTKLRALYQRKKGRDLFDLSVALAHFPSIEIPKLIKCFNHYMDFVGSKVSQAEFEKNLIEKIDDITFRQDIISLLPSNIETAHNSLDAMEHVQKNIISHLSGEAWKGKTS